MNNEEIIFQERLRLVREGIIEKVLVEHLTPSGEKIEFHEPEEIHTLKKWEKLGYKKKKGESPITTLKIWKPYHNKNGKGLCFKPADFYILKQMEENNEQVN